MLDIIGHRQSRRMHPWRREINGTLLAERRVVPNLCLNLAFQINNVKDLSCYWLDHH
jgi:hypothetical protein